MVTIMSNIPRRKIYETMLEFEDALIEMQILIFNQENFNKFIEKFNKETIKKISKTYSEIKALLILFLENKKYKDEEEYEKEHSKLIKEEIKTFEKIINNTNFPKMFLELLPKLEKKQKNFKEIKDLSQAKEFYELLDLFNSFIPKILEIRRDQITD